MSLLGKDRITRGKSFAIKEQMTELLATIADEEEIDPCEYLRCITQHLSHGQMEDFLTDAILSDSIPEKTDLVRSIYGFEHSRLMDFIHEYANVPAGINNCSTKGNHSNPNSRFSKKNELQDYIKNDLIPQLVQADIIPDPATATLSCIATTSNTESTAPVEHVFKKIMETTAKKPTPVEHVFKKIMETTVKKIFDPEKQSNQINQREHIIHASSNAQHLRQYALAETKYMQHQRLFKEYYTFNPRLNTEYRENEFTEHDTYSGWFHLYSNVENLEIINNRFEPTTKEPRINKYSSIDFTVFDHLEYIGGIELCDYINKYIELWNSRLLIYGFEQLKHINYIETSVSTSAGGAGVSTNKRITKINNESMYHILYIVLNCAAKTRHYRYITRIFTEIEDDAEPNNTTKLDYFLTYINNHLNVKWYYFNFACRAIFDHTGSKEEAKLIKVLIQPNLLRQATITTPFRLKDAITPASVQFKPPQSQENGGGRYRIYTKKKPNPHRRIQIKNNKSRKSRNNKSRNNKLRNNKSRNNKSRKVKK